jgi:leucine dehydrogenase
VQACVQALPGVQAVAPEAIYDQDVDVFAPCALGAILDDATLPRLRCAVVAGAANNQLAEPRHGEALRARGILYAPDYVINAGGIINISYEGPRYRWADSEAHLRRIGNTLGEIFRRSEREQQTPERIADRLAESIFRR